MRTRNFIALMALGACAIISAPSLLIAGNAALAGQMIIVGPTAGRAICSEPVATPFHKEALCFLDGYFNAGSPAQAYPFPVAFEKAPGSVLGVLGQEAVGAASLPLPANMTAAVTGWIIVEGY